MGFFSKESPFDQSVDKATLETNTKEDWALILDICDKVSTSPQAPKECLRSIIRRLNHQDPHVAIQAITLLDACVSNCGQNFHLEIASREFDQEFRKILQKASERTLRDRLLGSLEKWSLNEFKKDPQLSLIPSLYNKLKASGVEFPSESPSKGKKASSGSSSGHQSSHKPKTHAAPDAARKEEEDLAKAIELSLKETQASPQARSLYPQAGLGGLGAGSSAGSSSGTSSSNPAAEPRKVRALYDFEAAEDNELTFYAGEIVHVLDDTDANWWEGSNQRGTGLFPANFVTADLSAEPPKLEPASRKSVQFNDEVEVKTVEREPEVVEIDEAKIDRSLHFLHEADPTGEIQDPAELGSLEDQVQQMGPLIDQELERIDRRHAQLTRLGTELVDALNMYHHLMREGGPPQGMGYNPGFQSMPNMSMGMPPPSPWAPNPHQYYPGMQYAPPTSMPPIMMNQSLPNGLPQQHQQQQQVTSPTHLPVSSSALHIPNGQQQLQQQHHPNQMQQGPPAHQMNMMQGPMPAASHQGLMQGQGQQMMGPPPTMSMPQVHHQQQQQDQVTTTVMSPQAQHPHMSIPQLQYQQQQQHPGIQYQIPGPPQQFYQHPPPANAMM